MNHSTPSPRRRKTPSYRRQRKKDGNDLAFVEIDGRRHYLGPYETAASRERYHRLVAEWEAAGGLLPAAPEEISVVEVANHFLKWARGYYVKHGKVTDEPENIALAVRPLLRLLGAAKAFSSMGDQVAKMAKRTGLSVETLSELRFVASPRRTTWPTPWSRPPTAGRCST